MAKPRIGVIGAGGTIAMEGAHAFDWLDYGDTGIINAVDTILQRLDLGLPGVELVPCPVRLLPSTSIVPADWFDLAQTVDRLLTGEQGLDGVVITHGTASLEETAFFLDLVHARAAPAVVVGAQRPPNTASSDAAANLRAAVLVAADPRMRGTGVSVVMNNTVHLAASVTKLANHELGAFVSPEFGPLGAIDPNGQIRLAGRPLERTGPIIGLPVAATDLPRVDIALSYAGADGAAIDAYVASGARGIVLAGFPPGRSTGGERAAAARAVQAGCVVIQSSRAPIGRVPQQRYNDAEGILSGGGLSPQKARILLMLALSAGLSAEHLQPLLLSY